MNPIEQKSTVSEAVRKHKEFLFPAVVFCFLIIFFFHISVSAQAVPELILFNGQIFTSDAEESSAQAIAVSGERISAIGSNDEIKKLAGAKTRLIDLQNRVVTSGFNDAHNHFMPKPQGFHLQLTELEPSWRETVDAIKKAVGQIPKGQWIFGEIGGNALAAIEANRATLDQIAPDNPIVLETYFGHGLIVNTKAMALLKIGENEASPLGGVFELDDSKKLNGRMFEYAHWRQASASGRNDFGRGRRQKVEEKS